MIGGLIAGVLGLSILEAFLSSQNAAGNLGGAFTLGAGILRRLADPSVPLIPDRRTS